VTNLTASSSSPPSHYFKVVDGDVYRSYEALNNQLSWTKAATIISSFGSRFEWRP
jgi:hypothetical protein